MQLSANVTFSQRKGERKKDKWQSLTLPVYFLITDKPAERPGAGDEVSLLLDPGRVHRLT